ncbi:MAG: hypothetical protein L0Z53_23385 [Acidobacteriales bacterium]|nr:hypothetical protein [Terriglobales bacterium]
MAVGLVDEMIESCFLPLYKELERARHGHLTPDRVRDLLTAAVVATGTLEGVQDQIEKNLSVGAEGQWLAAVLKQHVTRIEACLDIHNQIRQITSSSALPQPLQARTLAAVDDLTQWTEKMHDHVVKLLHWLASPPPAVDPDTLGGLSPAASDDQYENIDDVVKRL